MAPKILVLRKSLPSSWATCIHHSCGSFSTSQITEMAMMSAFLVTR